jgi:hypothetical protein
MPRRPRQVRVLRQPHLRAQANHKQLKLTPYFGAGGIFAPDLRASESPMAIACFGFVTFWPLPDFSLPSLNARISRSTDFEALGLYLRPLLFFAAFFVDDFFAVLLFFAAGMTTLQRFGKHLSSRRL